MKRALGPGLFPGLALGWATLAGAQENGALRVVLTFDDLPMTGGSLCDAEQVWAVTDGLVGYLEEHDIPSLGLATPGRDCVTPELLGATLRRWVAADAEIGNHTAHHPDLNGLALEAYLADLDLGQDLIDAVIPNPRRWFRPPLLHMGDEPGKKSGLEQHLVARETRLAPVTVDNQEWVYAAVYADARRRGDGELENRVAQGFLEHLEECMAFYETLSERVFGRQIPQVLLLHANLLNAELMPRIDEMLRDRGYRYVTMAEAVADPAYGAPDEYVGPRGLSWLQRWALARGVSVPDEPREAPWVAREFQAIRRNGGAPAVPASPSGF